MLRFYIEITFYLKIITQMQTANSWNKQIMRKICSANQYKTIAIFFPLQMVYFQLNVSKPRQCWIFEYGLSSNNLWYFNVSVRDFLSLEPWNKVEIWASHLRASFVLNSSCKSLEYRHKLSSCKHARSMGCFTCELPHRISIWSIIVGLAMSNPQNNQHPSVILQNSSIYCNLHTKWYGRKTHRMNRPVKIRRKQMHS